MLGRGFAGGLNISGAPVICRAQLVRVRTLTNRWRALRQVAHERAHNQEHEEEVQRDIPCAGGACPHLQTYVVG